MLVLRQTWTLALLVVRYWARAGLPNRLRKDQGRRASGALLRVTFLLLMVNWGYRIGASCTKVEWSLKPSAVAWLLVGLACLAVAWGAMGRGPGMRGPHSPMTSPLLDALPLSEASRVAMSLLERLMLYGLGLAALIAVAPHVRFDVVLLGLVLPTAGLIAGDSITRLLRTVIAPQRMARVSSLFVVLQFPSFMLIGGAPVLAKLPRATQAMRVVLPSANAILEGRSILVLVAGLFGLCLLGALAVRTAERIGYDRIDIVPTRKLGGVLLADLDLVRIERVLALREPGGRWLARGAFLYTFLASAGLLAASHLSKSFPHDYSLGFARTLGYVAIVSGFGVVQARATRMVVRDSSARTMLAPLPITPSALLRGKTRALVVQALYVAAPYALLLGLPGPASLRLEILWRALAAMIALMLAAGATVAIAFLTQGVGGMRVLGGNMGIETTLVAIPLLGVGAAPGLWSAVVSLACLAALSFEARRSALRCVRWMDDGEDFERETPVWRALLVFAAFQAALTLGRRALALAPIDDQIQAALAYVAASAVLLALTLHGRRGQPRMLVLPSRAPLWLLGGLVAGVASGGFAIGSRRFLGSLGVTIPPPAHDDRVRLAVAFTSVLLAPVIEEIFFRGWLQNTIETELSERRRWLAPLLGAFAFASLRSPTTFASGLVLGLVLGVLYARSRAIGPTVVAHAAHAATSLVARYFIETS